MHASARLSARSFVRACVRACVWLPGWLPGANGWPTTVASAAAAAVALLARANFPFARPILHFGPLRAGAASAGRVVCVSGCPASVFARLSARSSACVSHTHNCYHFVVSPRFAAAAAAAAAATAAADDDDDAAAAAAAVFKRCRNKEIYRIHNIKAHWPREREIKDRKININ